MYKSLLFGLAATMLLLLCGCQLSESDIEILVPTELNEIPAEETVDQTAPTETAAPTPLGLECGTYEGSFYDETTCASMEYYVYVPEQAVESMPLVIYLHGIGSVGPLELNRDNPMIEKAREVYGDDFPFLILAPSTSIATWASHTVPERLKALTDYITEQYCVDPDKIIITGHSLGSAGVYRMLELYGDYFSAAVPVSEPDTSEVDASLCTNVRIWGFAGALEPECSDQMQKLTEEINALGGNARFTEIENCGHGRSPYGAFLWDVFEWMIK